MSHEHTLIIRVRYPEVDSMGFLHHSRYLQYFEMGRIEFLRSQGVAYADLERDGVLFVVSRAEIKYRSPARYDDEVALCTKLVRQTHVRLDHVYTAKIGERLVAEGATTIACVDRDGKLREIPDSMQFGK